MNLVTLTVFSMTFGLVAMSACKSTDHTESNLNVIDGSNVTEPKQSPGTYGIKSYRGTELVGTASAVAVSDTTFLAVKHVVVPETATKIDRVDIIAFDGKVVKSFNPTGVGVLRVLNPNSNGPHSDIGAFIFKKAIAKLPHGFVSLAPNQYIRGQDVYIVGNGIQDYRVLNPSSFTKEELAKKNSGKLRFGFNRVAQIDSSGFYINGAAFDTPGENDISVSGPGDSGGSRNGS